MWATMTFGMKPTNFLLSKQERPTRKRKRERKSCKNLSQDSPPTPVNQDRRPRERRNLKNLLSKILSRLCANIHISNFEFEQELGKDILTVEGLTKKGYFEDVTFTIQKGEKVAFLSDKSIKHIDAV